MFWTSDRNDDGHSNTKWDNNNDNKMTGGVHNAWLLTYCMFYYVTAKYITLLDKMWVRR